MGQDQYRRFGNKQTIQRIQHTEHQVVMCAMKEKAQGGEGVRRILQIYLYIFLLFSKRKRKLFRKLQR